MLPGAEPLQVRGAGMQRFPELSSEPRSLSEVVDLWSVTATVRPRSPRCCGPRRRCLFKGGRGLVWRGRAPWLSARRAPDHLSPAGPRPFPVWWGRRAERTPVEALPSTAAARRMRTAGQVRGALTSWHSPSPFAVTLNIRVSCPPRSKLLSPPSPGSSRLRQRGRCGGAPGPAAAARPGPGAPPSAVRSRRRLRGARRSA